MADTPRKDHWASLLESIGLATASPQKPAVETAKELAAEVPAAPESPAAAAEPVASAPVAEPPKPAAKKPAKTSGHWGKLAGMLGLSVATPPEPEPEPEPVAETPVAPPPPPFTAPAPVAESRPSLPDDLPADLFAPPARAESESRSAPAGRDREQSRDRGRGQDSRRGSEGRRDGSESRRDGERSERGGRDQGRGRGRDDRRDEGERRPPQRDEQTRREGQPRRGFGDGLIEDWPPTSHAEPAADTFEQDEFIPSRAEPVRALHDEPAAEERLGFDRPSDEEGGEHRRRRRRRRRGGRRDEEETTTHESRTERVAEDRDEPVESFRDEPFVDDDFREEVTLVDEDVVAEESRPSRRAPGDSEGGEDRGPRRRRRRRRGGGGRRDEAAEAPRSAPAQRSSRDDDSDLEDDFEAERPAPPAHRGRPQRDTRRVASEDDEVDEMLAAELDDDGGEGHAHKKIPTWQETVGVLIDGNMSMRSERPETRGGRGRRPPHRGR